jgi:hypothetical protein
MVLPKATMCMTVYLAADLPLRVVAWDEATPGFHTEPLPSDDGRVRRQFSKPHVSYAGSYERCACGFQLGEYPAEYSEPDEIAEGRRSLRALAAYLREESARVGRIEVFACCDGDQELPAEHRRSLTPAALESDGFFFLEKELSTIEVA